MTLKAVDPEYLRAILTLEPGTRLHRLVARLHDTYIDDLRDEDIEALEQRIDLLRICHADGSRFQ